MYLLDTNILTALHTGNYKVINAIKQLEDPNKDFQNIPNWQIG
jgi:predicted nucleic acid-binding protein